MADTSAIDQAVASFQAAKKGKDVRAGIVAIGQAVHDAVANQLIQVNSTLSEAGQGADAKVVGDVINDVKSSLDDILSGGNYVDLSGVEIIEESYLNSSGEIKTNSNFMLSDYIELPDGVNTVTVNRNVYTPDGIVYPQTRMVF
jgi:hypothetical protein